MERIELQRTGAGWVARQAGVVVGEWKAGTRCDTIIDNIVARFPKAPVVVL